MQAYFEFHDRFNVFDRTVDHEHRDDEGRAHTFRAARPRADTAKECAAERKTGTSWARKRRNALIAEGRKGADRAHYDRGGEKARAQAIEYALWLAARDGVEVPAETHEYEETYTRGNYGRMYRGSAKRVSTWRVEFAWRYYAGHNGQSTVIAERVHFGDVTIEIPHTDYDPTIMPEEVIEPETQPTPATAAAEPVQPETPADEPSVDVFAVTINGFASAFTFVSREADAWRFQHPRSDVRVLLVTSEPVTDASEPLDVQDVARDTIEALGAILVSDFDADDSGAQAHHLPCRLAIGVFPALTLGDVLGQVATHLT